MPAQKLAATMLEVPPPAAPGFLPAIVARKDAVKKFMAGRDSHMAVHKCDAASNFAISVVGNNLFPAIAAPEKNISNTQAADYTIQMLHGMPSPCKIRASPSLLQSPDMSKHQRLARIETEIDGMLCRQDVDTPPTISKSHPRLAPIERTTDGTRFSSVDPSSSDPSHVQLRRLHGALLNSRSADVQLSKSKPHRRAAEAHVSHVDASADLPRSVPSRLSRLENTVSDCLARLSVSQDGSAGAWHWEKFQRLQRIEERLDQILTTALAGVDNALHPARLDPIVRRNQLLPHVVLAASAQERRMHALDHMKLQGRGERELQAALAFKADDSSKTCSVTNPFKPARCP
jgi:hypothetical protein